MRYMGGKGRIAKRISETILAQTPDDSGTYWEPFVGGGAVASRTSASVQQTGTSQQNDYSHQPTRR